MKAGLYEAEWNYISLCLMCCDLDLNQNAVADLGSILLFVLTRGTEVTLVHMVHH